MGRRKIEIQPILHDRNRSVTFLKRKNGLFKKAYELGVLCSVDVIVVVFGHNQKLYEYCSSSNGNPNRILDRRIHFNGEREGRGPHDFNGDKADAANDDNDNDNDNDDLDPGDESEEASRRQQSSSRSQMMQRQTSYSTRGRAYNSQGQREDVDTGVDGGASDRAGAAGLADSVSSNVPYHIAQLLAAAVSSSLDPNRQQQPFLGGFYNDPSSHHAQQPQPPAVNPSAVAAASSLGASLAQLLGTNPYLASQLALPNLLSMGALGLNPGGGTGFPGFPGGAFNTPSPAAMQNIHPLYNTPLLASLFQQQTQQQQQPSLQSQAQSQLSPILFQNLAQPQNQTQPDDNRDSNQRPSPPQDSGISSKPDWPVPPSPPRSRTPELANVVDALPSQSATQAQASTFLEFLNAISIAGAPQPPPPLPSHAAPAPMPNQNMNSTAFGNYGLSTNYGGASTSVGPSGQNPLSNLNLLGNLGLGINVPAPTTPLASGSMSGVQSGFPPGAFGAGSNNCGSGGGIGSASLGGPQEQRISMQKASRKRTRDGTSSAFDDLNETGFPLTSAVVDDLPPRGLERYMNESEDGTSLGGRSRGTEDLNDERRSDALQLDMGRATYEDDIVGARTRKRGRAS